MNSKGLPNGSKESHPAGKRALTTTLTFRSRRLLWLRRSPGTPGGDCGAFRWRRSYP